MLWQENHELKLCLAQAIQSINYLQQAMHQKQQLPFTVDQSRLISESLEYSLELTDGDPITVRLSQASCDMSSPASSEILNIYNESGTSSKLNYITASNACDSIGSAGKGVGRILSINMIPVSVQSE